MLKLLAAAVAVLFVIVVVHGRASSDALGKCLEKKGVNVTDSDEVTKMVREVGGSDSQVNLAKEIDDRSMLVRYGSSEGIAFVAQSDDDAREISDFFDLYVSGFAAERTGKVVVAWSSGPDDAASSAVSSCAD